MATIQPFLGTGAIQGSTQTISVKLLFFFDIGSGQFVEVSDSVVDFRGRVSVLGIYTGPMNIRLVLTDRQPKASSGRATLTVNASTDENATYRVRDGGMQVEAVLDGERITMFARPGGRGKRESHFSLSGAYNYEVRLVPR